VKRARSSVFSSLTTARIISLVLAFRLGKVTREKLNPGHPPTACSDTLRPPYRKSIASLLASFAGSLSLGVRATKLGCSEVAAGREVTKGLQSSQEALKVGEEGRVVESPFCAGLREGAASQRAGSSRESFNSSHQNTTAREARNG
jgi:hypothetical protein